MKYSILFLLLLFAFSCKESSRDFTASQQSVLDKLSARFESRDYIYQNPIANPFDEGVGKNVFDFHSKVRSQNIKKTSPQMLDAGIFQFASESPKSWGIEDTDQFNQALQTIKEFDREKGITFDSASLVRINLKLTAFARTVEGANNLIEHCYQQNAITDFQRNVLKSTFIQMSKASSLSEASAINETVEFEIANSGIEEQEKDFLLTMTSAIDHSIKERLLAYYYDGHPSLAAEAVVVIVIDVAIAVGIGAAVGGVVGTTSCCLGSNNSCSWSCVSTYVGNGALVGLTAGLVQI
jgi:hypothetical protein